MITLVRKLDTKYLWFCLAHSRLLEQNDDDKMRGTVTAYNEGDGEELC